jgi:DNA-binding IclR family transcriptional regulator
MTMPHQAPDRAEEDELARAVDASKAPAISRAVAILRLLGRSEVPLGVNPVARELGMVPSTCMHILRALVAERLVSFDAASKRYALDTGVLSLARQWLKRDRFNELAQPLLDQIAQSFRVTSFGVHVSGLEPMVVVAVSQSGANLQLSTQIGSRFPALVSATGRCIAAFGGHSEAELKAGFDALRWDKPETYEEWRAQVDGTRAQGFAVDPGRYIAGVTVVAAPVWSGRDVLSHVLVTLALGSILKGEIVDLREAVVAAGSMLSSQLRGATASLAVG